MYKSVKQYGKRLGKIIADARPGKPGHWIRENIITASLAHCNASSSEIKGWVKQGLIANGVIDGHQEYVVCEPSQPDDNFDNVDFREDEDDEER